MLVSVTEYYSKNGYVSSNIDDIDIRIIDSNIGKILNISLEDFLSDGTILCIEIIFNGKHYVLASNDCIIRKTHKDYRYLSNTTKEKQDKTLSGWNKCLKDYNNIFDYSKFDYDSQYFEFSMEESSIKQFDTIYILRPL